MATIDRERLKELASDPKQTSESICAGLGLANSQALYYEMQKDPTLRTLFDECRVAARAARGAAPGSRKQSKTAGKKRAPISTPPRNGNAKGGVDRELLRKLILEFNHIDVYGKTSEHFNDLRNQMGALL